MSRPQGSGLHANRPVQTVVSGEKKSFGEPSWVSEEKRVSTLLPHVFSMVRWLSVSRCPRETGLCVLRRSVAAKRQVGCPENAPALADMITGIGVADFLRSLVVICRYLATGQCVDALGRFCVDVIRGTLALGAVSGVPPENFGTLR